MEQFGPKVLRVHLGGFEQGKLKLNDPIGNWIPELADRKASFPLCYSTLPAFQRYSPEQT
jgi:hypothetical protein